MASVSRANIASKYCFPEVEIARKSSNSWCTLLAIAFPLLIFTGASSNSVSVIFWIKTSQVCSCFPSSWTVVLLLFSEALFIGKMAFNESFNNTISLGEALPVATLEINLSKSDICFSW